VQYVAVRCLFGLDWTKGDRGLGRAATESVDLLTSPLTPLLPFQIRGLPYQRLLDVAEELVALLLAIIEEKRAQPGEGRDALALMVHAHDDEHAALSDNELIGEAITLFVAGHDTQAKTLAWTLFLLVQHPKVLADVLDEIDAVLRGAPPTMQDVPRLVLVDRVLKESMRVLAPVPVSFIRVCQTEARLGPYTLPPKASVVLSPFITHRDPERYPEPARFKPERWEKLQPTPHEYLPFGAGSRMCIGAGFATLAMRLILPMILQRYRLTLAHGARISRTVRGNILGPKYGLPMLIAPQDRRFARREHVRGDIPELLDLS
jgi:cytochrome P450